MAAIIVSEISNDVMQDMTGPMRFLESALVYGTSIVAMLDDAERWAKVEGEPEVAADVRRAAFWRHQIAAEFGV